MMGFIYTGKAPNLEKMADNLLAAADKVRTQLTETFTYHFLLSPRPSPERSRFFFRLRLVTLVSKLNNMQKYHLVNSVCLVKLEPPAPN